MSEIHKSTSNQRQNLIESHHRKSLLISVGSKKTDDLMNIEIKDSIEAEFNFKTTPYRWLIMVSYTLSLIGYCIIMMSFSSISETVADIYEVDSITVNIAYTFFLVNAFVLNFPATYALEKYGIEKTFKISAVFSILGAWTRYVCV